MVRKAYLVYSLIVEPVPNIAPFPFPNNDRLEAKLLVDFASFRESLSSRLLSNDAELVLSYPGFYIILPG